MHAVKIIGFAVHLIKYTQVENAQNIIWNKSWHFLLFTFLFSPQKVVQVTQCSASPTLKNWRGCRSHFLYSVITVNPQKLMAHRMIQKLQKTNVLFVSRRLVWLLKESQEGHRKQITTQSAWENIRHIGECWKQLDYGRTQIISSTKRSWDVMWMTSAKLCHCV